MGDNSDSVARRRELRKRRILENAELRKQKIFGISSTNSIDTPPNNDINSSFKEPYKPTTPRFEDDHDETASVKSTESEVSSKSLSTDGIVYSPTDIKRLNEILRNIPDPLLDFANEHKAFDEQIGEEQYGSSPLENMDTTEKSEKSRYTNPAISSINTSDTVDEPSYTSGVHSNSGASFLSTSNRSVIDDRPNFLLVLLEHPAAPCFLALIVSILLTLDLGYLVSNSLVIPFCVWEIQQIIASYGTLLVKDTAPSLLEAALLLCGVRKSIVSKYIWISALIKDIFDDFGIYLTTIVIWQIIIGFPSIEMKVE